MPNKIYYYYFISYVSIYCANSIFRLLRKNFLLVDWQQGTKWMWFSNFKSWGRREIKLEIKTKINQNCKDQKYNFAIIFCWLCSWFTKYKLWTRVLLNFFPPKSLQFSIGLDFCWYNILETFYVVRKIIHKPLF